jgi:D-3-phosphoglycerate dehydrogenase
MKIVVLDDYEGVFANSTAIQRFGKQHEVIIYPEEAATEEALLQRIQDAEILVLIRERTPLPAGVLERLNHLRFIVQTGTGVAHIDMEAARRLHMDLVNMPGVSNTSVAELTFAMILSSYRQLPEHIRSMRGGQWIQAPGREINGKMLGIVGFGSIGKEVAAIAKAFGMQAIAWSPSLTPEKAHEFGVECVPLDELLAQADIVSLHLRAVPQFKHLLSRERLLRMKRGSTLINTSRSMLVDMEAAVELLQNGHLACAAFDVFDREPLPADDPIRQLDNITLTPHIGWITVELLDHFASQAVVYIERYLEGKSIH